MTSTKLTKQQIKEAIATHPPITFEDAQKHCSMCEIAQCITCTIYKRRVEGRGKYNQYKEYHAKKKKEYYEENKEELRAKGRAYHAANKEKIQEKNKERETCEFCGASFLVRQRSRHLKTLKHQQGRPPRIEQRTKEGDLIKTFPDIETAQRETNTTGISRVFSGERQTAGGFKWTKETKEEVP